MSELPPAEEVVAALRFAVAPAAGATLLVFTATALALKGAARVWAFDWRAAASVIAVLAAAAGVAAGNHFRGNPFPWTPDGKWWHWGWWAIGLAFAVEAVARVPGVSPVAGNLLRGTAAGIIAAFVTPLAWQTEARWWIPLIAASSAAVWAVVDAAGRRSPGGSTAAAMAAVCWGAAVVLIHNPSPGFTDISVCLCTTLGVLAAIAWVTRADCGAAGAAAAVPVVVLVLLGRALVDSKVPASSFVLVAAAPLALGVFLLPPASRFAARPAATPVKILLVLIPVLIAAYQAMEAAPLSFGSGGEKW